MKNNNLYPVFAYGKWGGVDRNGNQVIPIIYTYHRMAKNMFSDDDSICIIKDDKYGVLDISKRAEIIPSVYNNILNYDGKRYCILRDKIWYIYEKSLFYAIGEYDSVAFINEEFIQLEKFVANNRFGYERPEALDSVYSITEKKIIPKSEAHFFYNDLAIICIDGKYGFLNRSLELVIPAIYDYVENFDEGFAYAEIGNENYYVDTQGQQVISGVFKFQHPKHSFDFDNFDPSDDSNYSDDSDDPDHDEYDDIFTFLEGVHDGLACYKENGLIGLKGLNNQIVTPPVYDFIYLFPDNDKRKYICVIKNGKYGIIDKDGNTIVEGESECDYFGSRFDGSFYSTDLFVVTKRYRKEKDGKTIYGSKESLIDINNKQIIPPIYARIRIIEHNLALVEIENEDEYKYGVLDFLSQEFVIPLIYDECIPCGDLFFVMKDNKWGYLGLQGNEVMKVEQDFDHYIYNAYSYYRCDGVEWSWADEIGRIPDLSKCSIAKEVSFKDWEPIIKTEELDECPF